MKVKKINTSIIQEFFATSWAIDFRWLNSAWSVLSRTNGEFHAEDHDPSVLAAIAGTRPEGTRYTVVQENSRAAVIEVWGAIFPRANVYTEYSGGTSSELLIRDINAARKNPNIDEVKFIFHTPGGDVVGTAETCDAIRELKKVKKTTAFVKGNCCSAGYWMASACHEIHSIRTGQIGSLGVYSVYLDDKKWLEKNGLKEIVFRSEQSPDKNADPDTERGRGLVQVRMNDLFEPFLADVAQNREVTVEKVLSSFGKGDVLVAKKARAAGLIDKIVTFDEFLNGTAKESGEDDFSGGDTDDDASDKSDPETLNSADEINSISSAETSFSAENQNTNLEEENMSDKTKTEPSAKDDKTENPPAAATELNPATGKPAKPEPDYKTLFEQSQQQATEANNRIKALETAALKKDMDELARTMPGEFAKTSALLVSMAEKFGKDSAEFKSFCETMTAAQAQIDKGGLFTEKGETGADNLATASGKLDAAAKKLMAEDKSLSHDEALIKAAESDEELYEEYEAELAAARK